MIQEYSSEFEKDLVELVVDAFKNDTLQARDNAQKVLAISESDVLVYQEQDSVVGYIQFSKPHSRIIRLAVSSHHQKKGYASALLSEAESQLFTSSQEIFVNSSYQEVSFYLNRGYDYLTTIPTSTSFPLIKYQDSV